MKRRKKNKGRCEKRERKRITRNEGEFDQRNHDEGDSQEIKTVKILFVIPGARLGILPAVLDVSH